ncbi:hypothetical protein DEDE109153_12745 [Deinococcus deserti]|uniref:Outer membrane protein beta-barrel domain-containing protein n=1 Tax=Deinococcus deserti (strain DSM 17065 / CIP 109153 / LMG 22923 / VCD115) TaxID=546414 RepID=C1CXR5_DEIDV|nr:hypothetical protein [Deinococcus deserti]ACO44871.1 Conserved hypothetical protein, precursor [Deinococcus deserti VCD115]
MKKVLLGLMALTAASPALAAGYVGGSVGSGASLHYQQDLTTNSAMRYSLNLESTGFNFNTLTVGGSVDYLADIPSTSTLGGLTPYYGLGLGIGVAVGNTTGVMVYPHGNLGLRYQVSAPLSIFGEGNVGPSIVVSSAGTGIGFGFGAKIGLNYRIQ